MKHILVFGAVKAGIELIDYLAKEAQANQWQLTLADADRRVALSKTRNAPNTNALALNIEDELGRRILIATADIVISLLPPALHYMVAQDCLYLNKHLLIASAIDEKIAALAPQIQSKGLLFLYDVHVEHMSAMQVIHRIKASGGTISSFISHVGELPERDENPWQYKFAGNFMREGVMYKEDGAIKHMPYEQLFDPNRSINHPTLGHLAWHPAKDSLQYIPLYQLHQAHTFIRTTLHYPEFCFGWRNIIELKLMDETPQYDTDGLTLQTFFQAHFAQYGFSEWIDNQLTARFTQTKLLLEKLQQLLEAEQEADENEKEALQDFMMVDNEGKLMDVNLDLVKTQAAATVAGQMHEANLSIKQLAYLGMDDTNTVIDKGLCSAADVMEFVLEKKLSGENKVLVIQHEVEYEQDGIVEKQISSFSTQKASITIGVAAKLILQHKIDLTGLCMPLSSQLYEPILSELNER